MYNNGVVEVADDFNYLGTVFHYTGTFANNNEYVVGKSLKAFHCLLNNVVNKRCNLKLYVNNLII